MSDIYTQVWMVGTPKCSGVHCDCAITDYSQAIVVAHAQGSLGFCSLDCFLLAFNSAPAALPPHEESGAEETGDPDLLAALGYQYPHEERAA
jgi:hypothetical protein